MSRLTRALLGAAVAAVAVPASASASTLEVFDSPSAAPHAFEYRGDPGEINDIRVTEDASGRTIVTDVVPIRIVGESSLAGCRLTSTGKTAVCAANAAPVEFLLGDRNDVIRYEASESMAFPFGTNGIQGGAGNDTFFVGIRRNADGVLEIHGGDGTADKATYASSPKGVTVSIDGAGNDGHSTDRNNIRTDVEIVEGSSSGDRIDGSDANHRERFIGGLGDDLLFGGNGPDVFHEGSVRSGSDNISGEGGVDLVDYSQRTEGVIIAHDVSFNDGAAGERDLVDLSVEDMFGSQAVDQITAGPGPNVIRGFGGGDTIRTGLGNDTLDGGTGIDTLLGDDGDDTLDTVDNTPDIMRCGLGTDTLNRDLQDVDATSCEIVNSVGTLALAAKGSSVKLSWTHPVSWKRLRRVTVRLKGGRKVAGRIVIRPRTERIADSGAVHVKRSKLVRRGKKVIARLTLRYDRALAGKRLKADVIAADVNGAKQVERNAATLRVAG